MKVFHLTALQSDFRLGFFASSMNSQWETCQTTNHGCLLDVNDPTDPVYFTPPAVCYQGSVSDYYVTNYVESNGVSSTNLDLLF
jgi:hypothetical protein